MSSVNDFIIKNGVLTGYTGNDTVVEIPEDVKEIGGCVFSNMKNIESIVLSAKIHTIGMGAFKGTSIKEFVIPDSVKNIEPFTFEQCKLLENITIGKSVRSIKMRAFLGCSSLQNIQFNGTIEEFLKISRADSWDSRTGEYIVRCTDGEITKLMKIIHY